MSSISNTRLPLKLVGVYLHVALLSVLLADMHFLTLADNLDMLKAVDGIALGANTGRETLIPALGWSAHNWRGWHTMMVFVKSIDASVFATRSCCPLGCIPPTCLEVEQVAHSVLRLEVCTAHITLRSVLHNGVFEHI
jgi:hypothetical protein